MKRYLTAAVLTFLTIPAQSAALPGADRDAHGCIASAGYSWSSLRHACIRVFELGVRLNPLAKPTSGATLSAFLIFPLTQDDSTVEVFVPGHKASLLLHKQGPDQWGGTGLKLTRHGLQFELGPTNGAPLYQGGPIS